MHLTSLELEEFRSYRRLSLAFDPKGLRLFGANASGKTTMLEAIAMLATTRSPRTNTERDAIAWGSGEQYAVAPYARCRAQVERREGAFTIDVAIEADPERGGRIRKEIRLDGRSVRAAEAVGWLKAVLFSVEDVSLVSGSPAGRRRYLDLTISQLDGRYLRALAGFNRVLVQRNSLLKSFQRDRIHPNDPSVAAQLAFWDEELVSSGSLVVAFRQRVIGQLSNRLRDRFGRLAGERDVQMVYQPSLDIGVVLDAAQTRAIDALQVVVARDYNARLHEVRRDEVRRGVSLVGPHRDDISFIADRVDLAAFGSRGEQRLAVVALKLAEADLMSAEAGEPPVLLLDDVLSELDAGHRARLIAALAELNGQLVITATDRHLLEDPALCGLPEMRVEGGGVHEV